MEGETMEQTRARHERELKELQVRMTSKKRNATKKTRRGVNDECARLERELRERQAGELAVLQSGGEDGLVGLVEERLDLGERDGQEEETDGQKDETDRQKDETDRQKDETDRQKKEETTGTEKKKSSRNRQRERLARRAAEKVAAAEEAALEATSMPNRRALEGADMGRRAAERGLVEHEVAPDGHCLFSAVADQLTTQLSMPLSLGAEEGREEEQAPYRMVRRAAAAYMLAHEDDFAPFVAGGDEDGATVDFGGYVERMRDTAAWGGEPELTALARAYGVAIRVVQQDGRTEVFGPEGGGGGGEEEEGKGRDVWLAYYRHGYGLGEHYNSLRRR